MKLSRLGGRATTLASAIAITLFSGSLTAAPVDSVLIASRLLANATASANVVVADAQRARYTVVLGDPSLASYAGEQVSLKGSTRSFATVPRTSRGRVDVNSTQAQNYVLFLQQKQNDFIQDASAQLGHALDAELQMQHAINAVVLELTPDEANALRQRDDVMMVDVEHMERLLTDRGPSFIGATTIWNGTSTGGVMSQGEGVVIAELDTGIAWDSPSFAGTASAPGGDNYTVVNPLGAGNYLGLCKTGGDVGHCNSKLIGMYNYVAAVSSATDDEGHGSHTASTAAGNHRSATYIAENFAISGVAPHANIIAYKVCAAGNGATCASTASTQAANQAVADGVVDAINFSIGGGTSPWTDATSLAFLGAVNAGIFVAAAAGNDGPSAGTISHIEPWVETAAASSEDRVIGFPFNLTAPTPLPGNTQNLALRPAAAPLPAADLVNVPIIQSPSIADPSNDGCAPYPAGTFLQGANPAIAVLGLNQNASNCGSGARKTNAINAGAVGVIYVDTAYINLGASGNAWSMLLSDWNNVYTQILTNPTAATVSISATGSTFPSVGDVIADFSSRGPNVGIASQLIVKPEISAPGVDILAAYASVTGTTASTPNLPQDATRVVLENGTSMATPHTAGSGLLLRSIHPTWTPVQIRSALMLNAKLTNLVKANGSPSDVFDRGSGRVDLAAAAQTGLIMDETFANFTAANPAIGGKIATLNLPSMAEGSCVSSCSFTRTVQSARPHGSLPITWTLAVSGMPATSTVVSPSSLKIDATGSGSFTVTVDATKLTDGTIAQGLLTLTPSDPSVSTAHMPIAVRKAPPALTVTPASLSATQVPNTTTTQSLVIKNVGNPTLNWSLFAPGQSKSIVPLNISPATSGFQAGLYSTVAVPGFYDAENFDLTDQTAITAIRANGFALPSAGLTVTNTTKITFSVYADVNNKPAGAPGFVTGGLSTAPVWTYNSTLTGPGIIFTGGGSVFGVDLTAAGVPPLSLQAGRYWLSVFPNITGSGAQTAANPLWAWFYNNTAAQVGNRPVAIRSNGTAWTTATTANVNHLSAFIAGTAPCKMPTWASYAPNPTSGALAFNAQSTVTVTFDSTGLAPGVYSGEACFGANDPVNPQAVIALSLTVSSPPVATNAIASPSNVIAGANTLLTVNVASGTNPTSTGIQTRVNLSSIGGSASQPLFDDGTNGDVTASDGVYSFNAAVPLGTAAGAKTLPVTVTDAQLRGASTNILLTVLTTTSPSGTGLATPASIAPAGTTLLTVQTTAGTNPPSTGIAVTADLSSIGGGATQTLYDDGSNGDALAGDGIYSFNATVPLGTSGGAKSLPATITDAQSRSGSTSISLTVLPITSPTGVGSASPNSAAAGISTLLTVVVTSGTNPTSSGVSVTADLSGIGGSATQTLYDDGTHGDITAGDSIYSISTTVGNSATPGPKLLPAMITDAQSRSGSASIAFNVQATGAPTGVGLSTPTTLNQGGAIALIVAVTPGTNPASSGLTVAVDLTSIGGSATQFFYDDGTHGDQVAGDNVFSFNTNVPFDAVLGPKTLPASITDAQSRTGGALIQLNVTDIIFQSGFE